MISEVTPPEGKKCFSGIPEATFVEKVEDHMKGEKSADEKLRNLEECLNKYKFMETNLADRKKRLEIKIPDIKSSLDLIGELRKKKETDKSMITQFLLSDQVFTKAIIPPTDKVCLWLGANVMLEYTLDEAEALLTKNKNSAENCIAELTFDLDFLRNQMTITEVTITRIYNWDVKRRQQEKKQ